MPSPKFLLTGIFLLLLSDSFVVGDLNRRAGIQPTRIKNIVTFGDSYTDVVAVSNGGTQWPVYAAGYASVSLFPFARSGATCSNNITPRPFPSVFESQLPTYFQSNAAKLNPNETIYTLWIGTNDLGVDSLLTGSSSASLVDVTTCMVNWVKTLYESGARNFLFQNVGLFHLG
jgi:phospholipase/lecithinase/hemolysin